MDGLMDTITTTAIDDPMWVECAKKTALLVIQPIVRPLKSSKPLKQYDPLSLHKLAGEGQLAKLTSCIVWDIQKRSLWAFLQRERDKTRIHDIRAFLYLKINKDRKSWIPHCQDQSSRINHPPRKELPDLNMPPSEKWKKVGPTTPPVLTQTRPPPTDKDYPMGHREISTKKYHSLHKPNSHTIVRCIQIWHNRIQWQRHGMVLAHTPK